MATDAAIQKAASDIAKARPDLYAPLMEALTAHAGQRARECVDATPSDVQSAQGRAREAKYFLDKLMQAVQVAGRMEQRQQTSRMRV